MALTMQQKIRYKSRLEDMAENFKKHGEEKDLVEILRLVEPLIRSRVLSIVYSMEKLEGRHVSDQEDLRQEIRMKVSRSIELWKPKKGRFYTFFNVYMNSRLRTWMLSKHRNLSSKIIDYEISLGQGLFTEEVSQTRLSEALSNKVLVQEQVIAVSELSHAVSTALSEEIDKTKFAYEVFVLLLRGYSIRNIASRIERAESTVSALIRRIVKRTQSRLPNQYKELYGNLQYPFSTMVDIKVLCSWY